jgi:hypothetical protein
MMCPWGSTRRWALILLSALVAAAIAIPTAGASCRSAELELPRSPVKRAS